MRIGFDVDGVLADFIAAYKKIGQELGFEMDPSTWDMGMSPEQVSAAWEKIKATPNFWRSLPKLEPQLSFRQLQDRHELYFVTSRVPTAGKSVERQTAVWIWNALAVTYPQVVVVDPAQFKVSVYKCLKLDAFIEDKPSTIWAMWRAGQNVFVYDQPWNRENQAPDDEARRVSTIAEYLEKIGAE